MEIDLLAFILVVGVIALVWCRHDYLAWKGLGVGGLPHTFKGWYTMTRLRMKKGEPILTDILDPYIGKEGDHVYLGDLILRNGSRPTVAVHPIPHRQLDQHATTGISQKLKLIFDEAVNTRVGLVEYKLSFYEKHTLAVTLCHPECGHVYAIGTHGEIGHIHPSDGSMHMILSPSDTKQAINKKWGERHGLAGKGSLPLTYLFVYAPRDEMELGVAKNLLDAAIGHMSLQAFPAQPIPSPE